MKPLALVVEAQTSKHLAFLREECMQVKKYLELANYEVKVLHSPTAAKIEETFNSPEYRDRICVFHYCGHGDGESLVVKGDERDANVYFEGLANLLVEQHALRFVFVNACLTQKLEAKLHHRKPELTVFSTRDFIPDRAACDLAVKFYRSLAENDQGQGDIQRAYSDATTPFEMTYNTVEDFIKSESSRGAAADVGKMVESAHSRNWRDQDDTAPPASPAGTEASVSEQKLVWPWQLSGPRNLRLSDGWHLILPHVREGQVRLRQRTLIRFAILFAILSAASAYAAHIWLSSPAFQAAFSYGFPVVPAPETDEFLATGKRIKEMLSHGSPMAGFAIESVRGIICVLVLVLTAGSLYNETLPTDRKGWRWFTSAYNWVFIVIGLATFSALIWYNLGYGPEALQLKDERWNLKFSPPENSREWVLKTERTLWNKAGKSWKNKVALRHFYVNLDQEAQLLVNGDDDVTDTARLKQITQKPEWKEMYWKPYAAYLPYAIVNFFIVAFPILFFSVKGTVYAFQRIQVYLRAMEARLGHIAARLDLQQEGDHIIKRARGAITAGVRQAEETFDTIRSALRTYLCFMCLIALGGIFEVSLGHLTLAALAKVFVVVSIVLMFVGFAVVGIILIAYDRGYGKGRRRIQEFDSPVAVSAAAKLENYSLGALINDPVIKITSVVNVIALISIIGFLLFVSKILQ